MDFVGDDAPIFPGSYWQSSTDWAGKRGNSRANLAFVKARIERYGCFAILTDGPNGFVAGSPNSSPRVYPPYPAGEVVDATGSGDIFRAGMLYGLEIGWPPSHCLQFASAAGCLACQSLGATASVPTVAEVQALIAANTESSERYD
jgi:sugar/nucleoside kinase (ribokinase family)